MQELTSTFDFFCITIWYHSALTARPFFGLTHDAVGYLKTCFRLQSWKKIRFVDHYGYQCVDEYPSRSKSTVAVLHNDEDLMTIHAGSEVGKFARALVEKLFLGNDRADVILEPRRGETDGRKEAPNEILEKFRSRFFSKIYMSASP